MALDYKMTLVQFISYWHEYRIAQDVLVKARQSSDVDGVIKAMNRVNEIRKMIDDEIAPVLNTIRLDEQAAKKETPVIPLNPAGK